MTAAALSPFSRSAAVELANSVWRKRLLPVGSINYKGRVINFTRDYLADLAATFARRAYDQVPFQLAADDNKHTNAVERFAGEIVDLQAEQDGLYCLGQDGAKGRRDTPQ